MAAAIGLIGIGHALPVGVRCNDDVAFGARNTVAARGEASVFHGYRERHVLAENESLGALVAEAARRALADAGADARSVDRLYGGTFGGAFVTPSELYGVHHELGMRRDALVVPVGSDFTNLVVSVVLAREAILAQGLRTALVVAGSAATRVTDPATPHGFAAGDGAAAWVVGRSDRMTVVDHEIETLGQHLGVMTLADRTRPAMGAHDATFHIDDEGVRILTTLAPEAPARLVGRLLERNGVRPGDVALATHQPSRQLMDQWATRIRPRETLDALERFGNATSATVGLCLSALREELTAPYVVLLTMGLGIHFAALLLRR
jgi:3-oxoacyl-[acyl-carrier-protein] synthase-3